MFSLQLITPMDCVIAASGADRQAQAWGVLGDRQMSVAFVLTWPSYNQ